MPETVTLPADSNQALGLGRFAIDFVQGKIGSGPSQAVLDRTCLFHTDSVFCGLTAIALGTSAPTVLRAEALTYPDAHGATPFGTDQKCKSEKAIVANCSAVREWDSNGTNFGFNPERGDVAGEFGHNDFYPVAIAVCQERGLDGAAALRAMVLIDEIRGRLAEVFSLKSYKIDHVLYGAIGSAAAYGALRGATAEQIESAIGMVVAHYTPWRAIRAGKQLSDSKGASAAITTEAAILSIKRSMAGFIGPKDIFRNPESLFRQFEPTRGGSPFELTLSHSGDGFAVMGMHFKIGLYEHQSAGGIQAVLDLLTNHPHLKETDRIASVLVKAYEPAFGIIGDPAKRDPQTRQSADHSMVYILATVLRKASEAGSATWSDTMLMPQDYDSDALANPITRSLIEKIAFEQGGPEYDALYPDGIPTSVEITDTDGQVFDSGLVMYPAGHARNQADDLGSLLRTKFERLGRIAFGNDELTKTSLERLERLGEMPAEEVAGVYNF
jgi:2-methylcitrate dehydratase